MHPATPVIILSTLSGAGFGLLFWLGLGFPAVFGRRERAPTASPGGH